MRPSEQLQKQFLEMLCVHPEAKEDDEVLGGLREVLLLYTGLLPGQRGPDQIKL